MANQRLSGKAAIVTGGGDGIGQAVCQVLAREGASVAVVDINERDCEETAEQLSRDHNNAHCVVMADVTKSNDVKSAFETAEQKLGKKCTVLVNCADIFRSALLGDTEEQDFDDVISVNLKGTFLMSKEFVNSLKDSDKEIRGTLVNVSSLAGKVGARAYSAYTASKSAVIGLTKSMALEYQEHKIRSNVVLPGMVGAPDMTRADVYVQELKSVIPMQRFAHPEDVANAVLFLTSDESSYINGAVLEVGGGYGL